MTAGGRAALEFWKSVILKNSEEPQRSDFRRRTDESLRQERGRSLGDHPADNPANSSYLNRVRSVTDACWRASERRWTSPSSACSIF
jgi:hypothetical protein